MPMYKVPVKVYQTPTGKTLWIPTYMRIISYFLMTPAASLLLVAFEFLRSGEWKVVFISGGLAAAFIIVVVLLRKGAKSMAAKSYQKELEMLAAQKGADQTAPAGAGREP